MFKLIAKGQGAQVYLELGVAESFKLDANQNVFLNTLIEKDEIETQKFLQVQAISLIGSCKVYASTNTKQPNKSDN